MSDTASTVTNQPPGGDGDGRYQSSGPAVAWPATRETTPLMAKMLVQETSVLVPASAFEALEM